ncbi:MAG: hypothetical protein IIT95_02565 [Oscillospiraceae bacterium]|nr:hypothetical protein [Oscillospiraceae bacterium]MBQ5503958.1 hypothetical protein [Oscillospiraceae bacterium]
MKKTIAIILSLVMLAGLISACGGSEEHVIDNTGTDTKTADTGSAKTEGYVFETKGVKVVIDADMAPVLSALGEASSYFEEASCAFEGIDKTYSYSGFEIKTYPSDSGDKIQGVFLTDDRVATSEGLRVGSTKADMESIYGTDYTVKGTEYAFEKGGMQLRVTLKDDVVNLITYASEILDQVTE